jgi:DNA-binding SARP family transcriptional activator
MEFRILGDLEAQAGESRLSLGLPADRKVLGLLVLHAGRVVPLPQLVDALWEDNPPATAAKQVRNSVSRLRRMLADAEAAGAPGLIETRGGGYLIAVAGAAVDSLAFEAEVAEAETAASAGRLDEAARLLSAALGRWRGLLLAGLDGRVFRDAAAAWEERRCAVTETYHDHQLALGRHREMLAELARFAGDYPLRERPAGQLMLALYRCGRQADALSLYDRTRARLAADLGLDPGPELQRLRQQVLTADPALNAPQVAQAERRPHPVVPRQLPAAVGPFTGRCPELKTLDELIGQAGQGAGSVVISAIDGTAGVGKTALAVYWAHQVAERFPDGQLYVNLRGFDPAAPPMDPAEAIRGFLDAYEVPGARIPASPEAQAGLYRSVMAGKRALVVLDNARDSAQVRPLLPGSPGCLVVVTSRRQLTGVAVAHGARPVTLGLFACDEARDFLGRRLGRERITAEPYVVAELIELCARLPLALSIVAARALSQPGLPLAALAAQLRDTGRRLDALDSGDAATGVRPVLSWSYQNLTADAARMFRLMALHPGPDIAAPAIASLVGVPARRARGALAELTRAHLLAEQIPGRYAFHDLLRAYAAEQARATDSDAERRAAINRMLDHYVHTGHTAARLLHSGRGDMIDLDPPAAGVEPEHLAGHAEALAWFGAERQVLLVATSLAADEGFGAHAWKIPWTVVTFLEGSGRWRDWIATQRTALAAAERQGDSRGQANGHRFLGLANVRLGLHEEAVTHLQQALLLTEQGGDRVDVAREHLTLGWALAEQGTHREALSHAQQALDLFTATGHAHGQASALGCAAVCLADMGDVPQAVAYGERALTLQRELGNQLTEADSWDTLGYAHYRAGRFGQAVDHYLRGLELCRPLGDRYTEAEILIHIGDARYDGGDPPSAHGSWQQALVILDELEHPNAAKLRGRIGELSPAVTVTP